MPLATDHTFHIGEQHVRTGKPCQDYTLSGTIGDTLAYAIVSDGCSSGGLTDIGARLMVLATKRAILDVLSQGTIPGDGAAVRAINTVRDGILRQYQTELGLEVSDLLATCLWAVATPEVVVAHIVGDGVVAIQYEEDLVLHSFTWAKNMPYYPAYAFDDSAERFKTAQSESDTPLTYIEEGTSPTGMGDVPNGALEELTVEEGMDGLIIAREHSDENETPGKITAIALFSDGVTQVDKLSMPETVKQLTAFKSKSGQFGTRRMNRFLTDVKKSGRGPLDDIAYAVITLDSTTET
jgi:hypothetical protein